MAGFKIEVEDVHYFQEESTKAIALLFDKLGYVVEYMDFQTALANKLVYSLQDHTRLPLHRLNARQMVNIVDVADLRDPGSFEDILMADSILPSGVAGVLNEETVKNGGEIWRVHAYDKDPFPSIPHAHNLRTGYKLHLGNGTLYTATNKSLGSSISKKDLETIRAKIRKITLPPLDYGAN
ncbi:hypothetical protein DBR11_14900 [Pedobacter sp. HMWF019]|uniref:hypothetical protein n=1 Tax=Pedobacter sp. HMWF019 TaxID=2056856 RepID=UPI000D3C449F|nr:hypothetical protein [Pedobacter sp. HMWF019]PTS98419.1 hypothetical protein DBR11_14900 [Pedobacter sp. HMWF019]